MNPLDGDPEDAAQRHIEVEQQHEEAVSAWPYIRQLQAASREHRRKNHFAERIRKALQA